MKLVVTPIHFYPTTDSHGYAIEKQGDEYAILFVEKKNLDNGQAIYFREAQAMSRGRDHIYATVFLADYVLRHDIMQLYSDLHKVLDPLVGSKIVK